MRDPKSSGDEWRRHARKISGKINVAWWLDKLAVPLVISALAASCLILVARRELEEVPWLRATLAGLVLLLGVGLLAWWLARRNFESPDDALVRIEASMKMRNALSAAKAGVTPWPNLPGNIDDGTSWRWSRLLTPLLAAVLFLTASILLPVSARTDPNAAPLDEPQAWKNLEADIETLAEDDTVQEEYLEELQDRLDKLRKQDQEDWYSHSSIEATDALEKMHGSELENMERNLRKAERALNSLQKHDDKISEAGKQRLLDEFQNAMQGLNEGKMKPNKGLLDQLQQLDPENLGQLDQKQLDQLRENMKEQAAKCQQCEGGGQGQGQGGNGESDWLDDLLNEGQDGNPGNPGGGQPQDGGKGQGGGGTQRGPGTAPGVLGQASDDVSSGELTGLQSEDLSKSLPGDLLQLNDTEHEVDRTRIGPRAGGGVDNEGKGGDRIWKDSLLPAEKKALREFFK